MAKVKKLLELTSVRAIKIATGEIFSILDLVLSTFLPKEIVPELHFFILLDFAFCSLEAYLDSSNLCFHGQWKLGRDTWFSL